MYLKTNAVVLKRTKLSEKDVLVTLLSEKDGVIEAVANNVKSYKSKLSSGVHPFIFGEYTIKIGSKWNKIYDIDIHESFYKIRDDLYVLSYGSYLLELCYSHIFSGSSNYKLLSLLVRCLEYLNDGNPNLELVKSVFELKFLVLLGYQPKTKCEFCGNDHYNECFFLYEDMNFCCEKCQNKTSKKIKTYKSLPKLIDYIIKTDIRIVLKTDINVALIKNLDKINSKYLSFALDKTNFKTLKFLNSLKE